MTGSSDIEWLYYKFYSNNPVLKRTVYLHSLQVAKKALQICEEKNLSLEKEDIYMAAMLHDIGVFRCNAPSIFSYGHLPYLQHGLEGEKILNKYGFTKFSNICTTHTGAGISIDDIKKYNLPLPEKNMVPETLLEKLICYADKFYSKSNNLLKEKTLDDIIKQIKKFGEDSLKRFMEMNSIFGIPNINKL